MTEFDLRQYYSAGLEAEDGGAMSAKISGLVLWGMFAAFLSVGAEAAEIPCPNNSAIKLNQDYSVETGKACFFNFGLSTRGFARLVLRNFNVNQPPVIFVDGRQILYHLIQDSNAIIIDGAAFNGTVGVSVTSRSRPSSGTMQIAVQELPFESEMGTLCGPSNEPVSQVEGFPLGRKLYFYYSKPLEGQRFGRTVYCVQEISRVN